MVDGTTPDGVPPRYLLTDWTGHEWRTFSMYGQIRQSPDGSRALVDGSNIIDASGTGLGTVHIPGLPTYDVTWADDDRHVCAIGTPQSASADSGQSSLWLFSVNASPRQIAAVGRPGSDTFVATCSMATNRAVILGTTRFHYPPPQGDPYEITMLLQVVDLTTGKIIYGRDYSTALPNTLISAGTSPDGRYLVEDNLLQRKTTITELATGHTVAAFTNANLIGFSWDDHEVALHVSGGNVDETRVVDLATGHIIWKDQGSLGVLFRQGSADFVVRQDHPGGDYDLLLVPASGNPRIIARQVFVSW
jgi:hypothetical protein